MPDSTPIAESFPAPDTESFPFPTKERWQPLRSGLLNLFRYDFEEFHFSEGRLLLRGNNGCGKSRVLALQLPFLLDGEIAPYRVEPDLDPAKRMEWNLLMGRYPDRLGYTWIEFGRLLPDGTKAYLTLGCGLRATKGQGVQNRWYFITSLRHGRDFFLQTSQGQPLSRDKLEEVLKGYGQVYRQAREYRRHVDEALFKLGSRYDTLIELLIRLRQPQLSRKLEENVLSDAMSEALSPLPDELVDEVAESFRGLESDRETLNDFVTAAGAVSEFQNDYRLYIRIAARRRAESVRTSHSSYETAQRTLREAERELQAAQNDVQHCKETAARLEVEIEGAREQVATFRSSPEMRRAEEVERARDTAEKTARDKAQADRDAQRAGDDANRARTDCEEQVKLEKEASLTFRNAHSNALERARNIELDTDHLRIIPENLVDSSQAAFKEFSQRQASNELEHLIRKRRESTHILREKNQQLVVVQTTKEKAEEEQNRAADALSEARTREQEARRKLANTAEELFTSFRHWCRNLRELSPENPESLAERFFNWVEVRNGPSPLAQAADRARDAASRRLTFERTTEESRRTSLLEQVRQTEEAIRELEEGIHIPPPTPHTRLSSRDDRPGAPFWKTCDFLPEVSEQDRAGIESALEAAGLLDAWLLPDGTLIDPATEDTFLQPGSDPSHAPEHSLAAWLRPALDTEDPQTVLLTHNVVQRALLLLGGIKEIGDHWVSNDGSWRLGPLQGFWRKPGAEHIGESSRAAARRRRLAQLREELAAQHQELDSSKSALQTIEEREQRLRSEYAEAPSEQPLLRAAFTLADAAQRHIEADENHQEAVSHFQKAREIWEQARKDRDATARDLKLTSWVDCLDQFREALANYEGALNAVWPNWQHWVQCLRQLNNARLRAEAAERENHRLEERRIEVTHIAIKTQSHYETLEASQGKEAREIRESFRNAQLKVEQLDKNIKTNQDAWRKAAGDSQAALEKQRHQTEQRNKAEIHRAAAIDALKRFAEYRLLEEADDQLLLQDLPADWSVSRAVDVARHTEQVLRTVEATDETWRQRQQSIHQTIQHLRDRLIPQGHQPDVMQIDDITVVRVLFQARTRSINELRKAFEFEVEERRRLLDAKEREVIENHLIGEAAAEMQRRLRDAENWVRQTNAELESRPTSTGMLLRFAWIPDPDGPQGLDAARKLLLRTTELWTPEEREGLARFLQDRIQAEQIENPSASWRDRLASALDYRRWHRFVVERRQNGEWHRLTRRTYGTGSGGEKALALTLPQFAAAAAHYRSACPEAPRLILLDEAFVGIDREMRAKCMGLLVQFDLDFVMTSESEWGCYGTVPSLTICHLLTRPGIEAVAVTRWQWNGQELKQSNSVTPPAKPNAATDCELQPASSRSPLAPKENNSRQEDLFHP